ncbi:MAG: TatD family hydrolase [Thaumarchaeota archaeon]|nr:TatD family hydrolase [Nitrososphaerota archaeon]
MLIDAHSHAYDLPRKELEKYRSMRIVSVSEDLESSLKTLSIAEEFPNIIPFIGVHPWRLGEVSGSEVEEVLRLVEKRDDVKGIGEVGLDREVEESYGRQKEVFKKFCSLASEYDLPVNVHARAAWKDALEILEKLEIEKAVIHWYSGPIELLEEIAQNGYMITINPAVKIQEKHRRVLEEAELNIILTESDSPYRYRGLDLKPEMIRDLIKFISEVKRIDEETLENIIASNFRRLIR